MAYFRVVAELQKRFTNYLQSGDDSHVPSDLERIIFKTVCGPLYVYISFLTYSRLPVMAAGPNMTL